MLGYAPFAANPEASTFDAQAKFEYVLTGDTGMYACGGNPSTHQYGLLLIANTGGYAVNPANVSVKRQYGAPASDLAYAVAGAQALLQGNRQVLGSPGEITCSYADATFDLGYNLIGHPGAVTVAMHVTGVFSRRINAASGAYAVVGAAPRLVIDRAIAGTPGAYALVPAAIDALFGFGGRSLAGSFGVQGAPAVLSFNRALTGAEPSYAVSGEPGALTPGRRMTGLFGRYDALPQGMGVAYNRIAPLQAQSFVITAKIGTLKLKRSLVGAPDRIATQQPFAVVGTVSRRLVGTPGGYAALGQSATLERVRVISGGIDTVGVAGAPGNLSVNRRLSGVPILVQLLGAQGTLTYSANAPRAIGVGVNITVDMQPVADAIGSLTNDAKLSGR